MSLISDSCSSSSLGFQNKKLELRGRNRAVKGEIEACPSGSHHMTRKRADVSGFQCHDIPDAVTLDISMGSCAGNVAEKCWSGIRM
jgi:hypothetical protein